MHLWSFGRLHRSCHPWCHPEWTLWTDIRREVLGTQDILEKPLNDIIALMGSKEIARNVLTSSSLAAISSSQKQEKFLPNTVTIPSQADWAKEAICPGCHNAFKVYTKGPEVGTRDPTKHVAIATGPIAATITHFLCLTHNQCWESPQRWLSSTHHYSCFMPMPPARSSTTTSPPPRAAIPLQVWEKRQNEGALARTCIFQQKSAMRK